MKEIKLSIPQGCNTVIIKVDGEQVITEFEPVQNRWRAVKGDRYYFISNGGMQINCEKEVYDEVDDSYYASGNYFKTEEAARRAAQQVREIFKNCNEE